MKEISWSHRAVYRLVCRCCKVVFISTQPYTPVENLHCFCGTLLQDYNQEDHWGWDRLPLDRRKLLQLSLKEVIQEDAETRHKQKLLR